ncbi:922_t:CDS:1, partial [Entrophospora sp. SA101]
ENIHEELLEHMEYGNIEEQKISTISNWITRTYVGWKKKMEETLSNL